MKSINKYIISLLISVFIVFLLNAKAFATTGTITEITVNMREKASTDSKIVSRVTQDDKVEVLEKSGDWYKIKAKNKTGFIYGKYIKVDDSEISEENLNDDDDEVTKDIEKSFYISNETKMCIAPNISSTVIYTSEKNIDVQLIEQMNNWSYIKVNAIYGWVKNDNLKEKDSNTESENKNNDTKTNEQKNEIKYIKYDKVNLRKEPSVDSTSLEKLSINTEVNFIEEVDSKWSKIEVDGKTGYVSNSLLSSEKQNVEENEAKTTSRSSNDDRKEETNNSKNEEKKEESKANTENKKSGTTGQDIVDFAKKFLGYKYKYGAASPSKGFDCSGLTYYVYKNFGYTLARSAKGQAENGVKVEKSDLQPGDLVIYKGTSLKGIGHVGIYIGNNKMIHASEPGVGVIITDIDAKSHNYPKRYVMGRRILK